jgi:hypothetical protein
MPPIASPLDLTTLAKVKAYLVTTGTNADQTIQDFITEFSLWMLNIAGRGSQSGAPPLQSPFVQPCTFDEIYDGSGSDRQFVRNWPIQSVASVSIFGIAVPAGAGSFVNGYLIDASGKSIVLRGGRGVPFPLGTVGFANLRSGFASGYGSTCGFAQGVQNVEIVYTAGFALRVISNELQTIPATGPYTITVLNPWISDTGVDFFLGGSALTKVLISPAAGQYFVQQPGVYLFNVADAGKQVQISYSASGTPPDLEGLSRRAVATIYKRGQWIGQRSNSMAGGAGTISYDSMEFSDHDKRIIDFYRRSALV